MDITTERLKCRLAWCSQSQDLFNHAATAEWAKPLPFSIDPEYFPRIVESLQHAPQSRRVGILFEQCFESYLRVQQANDDATAGFDNIHARVQVNHPSLKATVGEMDFLFRDQFHHIDVHAELAVKFYLGVGSAPEQLANMDAWIGPNKKDRLDLKFAKLFEQQLLLSKNAHAVSTLKALGFNPQTLHQQYLVKGMLFWPFWLSDQPRAQTAALLPTTINPDCEQGYWLELHQLPNLWQQSLELALSQPIRWLILDRLEWIDDLSCYLKPELDNFLTEQQRWFTSLEALASAVDSQQAQFSNPVQVARFMPGSAMPEPAMTGSAVEPNTQHAPLITRYFVAPNSWSEMT